MTIQEIHENVWIGHDEVCRLVGLHCEQLARIVRKGLIVSKKEAGKDRRYQLADVIRLAEARKEARR